MGKTMKKLLCTLLSLTTLAACSSTEDYDNSNQAGEINVSEVIFETEETAGEVQYGSIHSDWVMWESAEGLVRDKDTDFVITAKVTDISFRVADSRTGYPPEEGAKERYDEYYGQVVEPWRVFDLFTVYDIETIATYKGEGVSPTQILMVGGMKDVFVEEQLAVIKEYGIDCILVHEGENNTLKIGETYLFVLKQFDEFSSSPRNPDQCIYNLDNPFARTAPVGYPDITAKDIISTFGKDKWDTFWADWQRSNPDWESRLDVAAVERALAE
ncbi:MAG: hypothetical protein FWH07_08445 [Oscillospiraceae bacterium]|nr:hypothetical protein [Oscillospiraceae bacterium]